MLFLAPLIYQCNRKKKPVPVNMAGANSKAGHLLRGHEFPEPSNIVKVNTLIVGAGVSGLSAGRWLKQSAHTDFLILEMDEKAGGNSRGGANSITEYPYGAHYLPIPNNDDTDLLKFLHENGIITGFNEAGLPVYNEYHLCLSPQERLYYRGMWHSEMPPNEGLPEPDKVELERFLAFTTAMKEKTGSDHKKAFAIPLENSSKDEAFLQYDKISAYQFLEKNGYRSEFIYWYLDYCCKDDFGTGIRQTSAWAALHYFSSRTGKAANASAFELLTWPEGNYFLVKKLEQTLSGHLKTGQLVYDISEIDGNISCRVHDLRSGTGTLYECQNLILATPQYVNKKLLKLAAVIDWEEFQYYPWLVANITISDKSSLNRNAGISWDNVIYDSISLGYVNACHQTVAQNQKKTVITYYYNFSDKSPRESRLNIYNKDNDHWRAFIIDDLKKAHPQIENEIEHIELHIWGHGMISPGVGFLNSSARRVLENGIGRIYFANSDVSGISIFEQAFYKGIQAAKNVLGNKDNA